MRDLALNDKQMEIFRATWPNLGWAAREREEQLKEQQDDKLDTDNPTAEGLV